MWTPREAPDIHPSQDGFPYLQETILTPEHSHQAADSRSLFLQHAIMQVFQKPQRGAILRKGNIKLYRKRRKLLYIIRRLHLAEKMSPTFRMQKNGVKNATVTQWQTGKHLFPVQVWADIVTRLNLYPGSSDNTPMNTVWV